MKIGDKVKVIEADFNRAIVGLSGEIVEVREDKYLVRLNEMETLSPEYRFDTYELYEYELELT